MSTTKTLKLVGPTGHSCPSCGQWTDAPVPKFTPAVERAAELLIREAESTGLITDDVRNGLAAALDVEEMAEVLWRYEGGQGMWADERSTVRKSYRARAQAVRAAILGSAS